MLTRIRFSGFYCLGMLSAGFSSILAYGIQQMKGLAGLNGWRWIFIIVRIITGHFKRLTLNLIQEGIITCVVAVAGHFLLVDFPDKGISKYSSPEL